MSLLQHSYFLDGVIVLLDINSETFRKLLIGIHVLGKVEFQGEIQRLTPENKSLNSSSCDRLKLVLIQIRTHPSGSV